eukprot:7238807-Karenia_brevis.AAC.1
MQPSQLVMRVVGTGSFRPQPDIHHQYSLLISILKTSRTRRAFQTSILKGLRTQVWALVLKTVL